MNRSPNRLAALTFLALSASSCEETLQVRDKARLTPENTSTDLLVAGAISDFKRGYCGDWGVSGGEGYTTASGFLADELYDTGSRRGHAADQRAQHPVQQGNPSSQAYLRLHQARAAAIRTMRALEEDGAGSSPEASFMKMYEGYTYVALGEGFCSGIPFSEVAPEGELIHGVPVSTSQVFKGAILRFDEALSIDGSNFASAVGKARALLDLGRYAEAATTVVSVPTNYRKQIVHSGNTLSQVNYLWGMQDNGRYGYGVSPNSPDPVRDRKDPRMSWIDGGQGFNEGIKKYLFLPMSEDRSSPVMLADGIEARLIEAEADLVAGGTAWLDVLNALRADVDNLMAAKYPNYPSILAMATEAGNVEPLDVLTDPGGFKERVKLLFDERMAWLAMTGHRLGDLRRLLREDPYRGLFTADEIFPSGPYFNGGDYGTDVNLAIDGREENNPHWDASMCAYSVP